MDTFAGLRAAFKDVTSQYKETDKAGSVVRLLNRTVRTLDSIIKGMDAFLKKKGVDLGKTYSDSKASAKGLIEKARDALGKDKDGNKTSIYQGLKNTAADVSGRMLGKFSRFVTSGTPPPTEDDNGETSEDKREENDDRKTTALENITDKLAVLVDAIKEKGKPLSGSDDGSTEDTQNGEKKPSVFGKLTDKLGGFVDYMTKKKNDDLDGDGIAEEKWIEKSNKKANIRKKEIEDEKAAVKGKGKSKKSKGPLGWILDKLLSLGGTIVGGIWSATSFLSKSLLKGIGRGLWWLGTKMLSGIGSLFTRIAPKLAGSIARGLQSVIGGGLRGAAGAVGRGLLTVGRAALPFAGEALAVAGRGAAMLLTGPVGWAVAAGTVIYGGYKLYKYLNRNSIDEDIYGKLTRMRLLSYGFNDDNKDSYSKVFDLEMLLKDNLTFNAKDLKLTISNPTEEQIAKVKDIFGVTNEEKARVTVLNEWFSKKFIPGYQTFVRALYATNENIYLDDLDKLSNKDLDTFLTHYVVPVSCGNGVNIPYFDAPISTVKKEDVEAVYASIKNEVKGNLKNSELKPEERMAREVAKERSEELASKTVKIALNKAMPSIYSDPLKKNNTAPSPYPIGKGPVVDGEGKPDVPLVMANSPTGNPGKLIKASGALVPGDLTLPGVSTKLSREAITGVDQDMLRLFTGMAKEYNSLTGKNIQLNQAFRSREEQERLYRTSAPGLAARPGNSPHEFGLAMDINSADTKALNDLGLLRKYGFTASVGGEPWHIEPIGVSLNPDKAKTDPAFRKDAITGSPGKGGSGFGLLPSSRKGGRDIEMQRKIFSTDASVDPGVVANAPPLLPGISSALPSGNGAPAAPLTGASLLMMQSPNAVSKSINPMPPQGPLIKSDITKLTAPDGEAKPSGNGLVKSSALPGVGPSTLDLSTYGNMSPVEAIKQASQMTGVSEETLMTFGKLESSLNPGVSNSKSSATGLFQITDPTWKELLAKHGPKYGIPPDASKTNPLYNALMAAEYAKANLASVSNHEELGVSKDVAMYLTHHFGPSGGKALLNAMGSNPDADVKDFVSSSAYSSNKEALTGKTVRSYIASLDSKFAVAKNTSANAYNPMASGGYGASTSGSSPMSSPSNDGVATYASYTPPTSPTRPEPTRQVSTSAYDVSRVEDTRSSGSSNGPGIGSSFSPDKMEGLLSNQLTTLTQIATILSTINDKFDMETFSKAISQPAAPSGAQVVSAGRQQSAPSTGVNLTRKALS